MSAPLAARLLPTRMVEKPWGCAALPPPFTGRGSGMIGEVWFEPPEEAAGLLAKYIFTSEKLSVQVHPDDDQALTAGLGQAGKEECWLVIDAQPGARLGIGFDAHHPADSLRAAALDGTIEQLLTWHPVVAGDFFYIPANTVHAIGAGVSLIEVQQNSDVTYRLYDYGRPRELHLDAGLAVAKGEPYPVDLHRKLSERGTVSLVEGPLFRLVRCDGLPPAELRDAFSAAPVLVIPLSGAVKVGDLTVPPGAGAIAAGLADLTVPPGTLCLAAQDCR